MPNETTPRKSFTKPGEIYFTTATINGWKKLLEDDSMKEIIISCFNHLTNRNLLDVFAFVIMPNHIHVIWRTIGMNGKESVQGSFFKYTAHEFKKRLKQSDPGQLANYKVNLSNKEYEFWKRDSLAVHLFTEKVAYQKLDYIHNNPLAEHWNLASDPTDYYYSSAAFYEKGTDNFMFLKDLRDEF